MSLVVFVDNRCHALFSFFFLMKLRLRITNVDNMLINFNVKTFCFSGPEMLVAFHSSPFSAPLQSNIPNRGFELDVDMFFVDSDSHDYAQGSKGVCEFNITASNTGKFLSIVK